MRKVEILPTRDCEVGYGPELSDDFSGFVDTCETGKRNRAGALVLGNGRIQELLGLLKF